MCRNQAAYRIILGWCKLNTYGSHGGAHIVGVGDALIHDLAAGDVGDIGPGAVLRQNGAPGGGGGPLGRGGALVAVGHRHPVLPLSGAEVGAGDGGGPAGVAAVDEHGRQRQGFAHGGAGTVQAVEGNAEVPQAEGGADALVQQVSGADIVQVAGLQLGLIQRPLDNLFLHGGFRLFPGLFSEEGIIGQLVKVGGQGALRLLLAADVGVGDDGGGMGKSDGAFADTLFVHGGHLVFVGCP